MDFFAAQEAARKRTGLLVLLFMAAVVTIVAVVYLVVHAAVGPGGVGLDPLLLAEVGAGVLGIVGLGSVARTASLRRGGPAVADLLGARRVTSDTSDFEERKLLNVVEEMAIASGTPVPAVYVMDREDGINAFAAGYSPHDAAVAVTRGALRTLNRDELQGVIAHEFSHILNGDMRLNIRLIGLLYGILLLAVIGRGVLQFGPRSASRRKGEGAGAIVLIGIALLLVGYIGVFFGRLIKSAISRQREFLADSAAIEFTRNPAGLAGALKKIGAAGTGSRVVNHHAEELSHMFFASGLRSGLLGFMSTHPPLEERIRRLDPQWDGKYDALEAGSNNAVLGGGSGPPTFEAGPRVQADGLPVLGLIDTVGSPGPAHLQYAASLLGSLPPALERALRVPDRAPALAFALLLSTNDHEARGERAEASRYGGDAFVREVEELSETMRGLGPAARLPLLDLVIPSLRGMSPAESERFLSAIDAVVRADGKMRLFELAMLHSLTRSLHWPERDDRTAGGPTSFQGLDAPAAALLSAVAWLGSGWRAEAASAAFQAGIRYLPTSMSRVALLQPQEVSVDAVEQALTTFAHASAPVRRVLLQACAAAASHDRQIEVAEMELLRAVSEALDCPLPPLVA